jgi:hypothetical protein
LRSKHLQEVTIGHNDQLACDEEVTTKKVANKASESVDSDESSLPTMP